MGLAALGAASRLAAQYVGIGTSTPTARLHVHGAGGPAWGVRVTSTGTNGPTVNFYAGLNTPDAGHIGFGDNTGWRFHITRQSDNTHMVTVVDNGHVGIGTVTPAARLHVVGRAIVDDGTTGTPTNSIWGSAGSRIILWPGSATTTPYQIGIAPAEMWLGVHQSASWSVFRGVDRQLIVSPNTIAGVNVNGNTNFPSISLGSLTAAFSNTGPYPKRGTFIFFGGPANGFEDNTDPALMYFIHLGNDVSRLRLHVEDNGGGNEGFSILGASCVGGCQNLVHSSLLFDFLTDGQAYKPGGGSWASISDARLKEAITPYTRGLSELRALRPVRYKYKKEYWAASDRYFTGLIAQEVQNVVPEMVQPYKFQAIGDRLLDVLAVDPSDLTYMLINAVKELDAENQQLKARLAAVEAEKHALESRLSGMESRLSALEGLRGSKE